MELIIVYAPALAPRCLRTVSLLPTPPCSSQNKREDLRLSGSQCWQPGVGSERPNEKQEKWPRFWSLSSSSSPWSVWPYNGRGSFVYLLLPFSPEPSGLKCTQHHSTMEKPSLLCPLGSSEWSAYLG
jgi:hypothetical protein